MLTAYNDKRTPSRRYCIGRVASIADVPAILDSVSPHFLLFLAVDATGITDDVLRRVAQVLIDRGLAYLCVWGEGCERAHDQFDLERDPNEPDGRAVQTTWHSDEPLDEALWYFANVAYPDESFEPQCRDWVAVAVGDAALEEEIRIELIDRNEGWPP